MERNRIESLDHLRGLMALTVMAYHYVTWISGPIGSDNLLGRLGVYAVSIFYVLSGLSLSLVYTARIKFGTDIIAFLLKRVFRIFPLYYVVITMSLVLSLLATIVHGVQYFFPWRIAILNYTLLFGFVNPEAYLSVGAWSIGNEMVFYSIFPLLFYFSRWIGRLILVSFLISLGLAVYFAFHVLSPNIPIESQWGSYINPFNQLFLFLSGVLIGLYYRPSTNMRKRVLSAAVGVLCVLVFALFPSRGDEIEIVTRSPRLLLSALCVVFVCTVFISNFTATNVAGRYLGFLGEGSYSIYLMHPLVAVPIVFVFSRCHLSIGYAYATAFIATLLLSRITYAYLERPMIGVGRRISARARALQRPLVADSGIQ
jgi:exopolysaccharide production protein ExoZ